MGETITAEDLRLRRQDWARALADEAACAELKSREMKQHRLNAERLQARIDEIDELLATIGQSHVTGNVIPLRKSPEVVSRTKPGLRYRTWCATTDIVAVAYATPGIDIASLVATVYDKYKGQGTSRDTIVKMVNRLIREKYALRRRGKLYLEDVGKRAWEASPLFQAS